MKKEISQGLFNKMTPKGYWPLRAVRLRMDGMD